MTSKHFEIKKNELEALKDKLTALSKDETTPVLRDSLLAAAQKVDDALFELYLSYSN